MLCSDGGRRAVRRDYNQWPPGSRNFLGNSSSKVGMANRWRLVWIIVLSLLVGAGVLFDAHGIKQLMDLIHKTPPVPRYPVVPLAAR